MRRLAGWRRLAPLKPAAIDLIAQEDENTDLPQERRDVEKEAGLRILLIEDDKNVAGFVVKGLREEGHNVIHADCAQVAIDRFSSEKYDVIILDRMLPDATDGLELITGLRRRQNDTPVLILSGLGEATNKVSGLKAGGDDYLAKPFAFAELLARVEALSRRGRA